MGLTITSTRGRIFFTEIRTICLKAEILWLLMFTKGKYAHHTLWQPFICLGLRKNRWFMGPHFTWSVYGSYLFDVPIEKFNTEFAIKMPAPGPVRSFGKIRRFFNPVINDDSAIRIIQRPRFSTLVVDIRL